MAKKGSKIRQCNSGIGGQAVLEGIMMRNKERYSVAVRKNDGEIVVEGGVYDGLMKNSPIKKWPFVRGVFGFVESLQLGLRALNISSEYFIEEETKKELTPKQQLKEKKKAQKKAEKEARRAENKVSSTASREEDILMGITMIISMCFAVGLFMILPYFISSYLGRYVRNASLVAIIEGVVRILIFLGYIVAISLMKDIRRLYQYHGAEHKCINCIESGKPLTVANVMNSSRQHKRCGTSFLLYVVAVSVILFFFIRVDNLAMKLVLRIALLPVIAGISYEIIRLAGRSNFFLVQALSAPGLLLQKLTTKEPDESMCEVAIAAVEAVYDWRAFLKENYPNSEYVKQLIEEEKQEALGAKKEAETNKGSALESVMSQAVETAKTYTLDFDGSYRSLYLATVEKLKGIGVPEPESDARLMLQAACHTDRQTMITEPDRMVTQEELNTFLNYLGERLERRPVQYILGSAPFMGLDFTVDERVLIPRFDTEILVEEAMKHVHDGMLLLDMCTGSGCVLLSLLNYSNHTHGVAVDLSADALELAAHNAEKLGLSDKVHFMQGDMWKAFDPLKDNERVGELKFDVLVSNPPYIESQVIEGLEPEVKNFEPHMALDGDEDGLKFYRILAEGAPEFLKNGAQVLFEIGYNQAATVSAILEEKGYVEISVVKDLAGHDRVVMAEYRA